MKTNLFLLGMAVAAFSSCTNEEVTDVAQNRAIKFNQFVENNTRQVTELDNNNQLNSFYVFGRFGNAADNYDTQIFNNESRSAQYYWQAGKFYSFGAYANGNDGQLATSAVSFNANDGELTFTDYTPNDTKDLVAAVIKMQCKQDASQQEAVNLTFHHMLSQVKFTFNTTDGKEYQIKISNLKINAVKTSTGNITLKESNNVTINWENTSATKGDYDYPVISDVANENKTASSESKLVIPQNGTDQLNVIFTATVTGGGLDKTANFTANLSVAENIAGGSSNANTWIPGYRYNYTAEINAKMISEGGENPETLYPITFNATVNNWETAENQNTTPQTPSVP